MMEEAFAGGVAPVSAHQRAGFQVDIAREVIDNLFDQLLRKGDTERHWAGQIALFTHGLHHRHRPLPQQALGNPEPDNQLCFLR